MDRMVPFGIRSGFQCHKSTKKQKAKKKIDFSVVIINYRTSNAQITKKHIPCPTQNKMS